jgi:hypothetical protein
MRSRTEERRRKFALLAEELEMYREWAAARWWQRPLFDRSNAAPRLGDEFQQLLDDSLIFNRDLHGYRLQPSANLQAIAYLSYSIEPRRANLSGVLLAPVYDLPHQDGRIGIEIVSPDNRIVAQAVAPLSRLPEAEPARFEFVAVPETAAERFTLRVFVREAVRPLRLFEWRKHRLAGLGPTARRAFGGFVFEA